MGGGDRNLFFGYGLMKALSVLLYAYGDQSDICPMWGLEVGNCVLFVIVADIVLLSIDTREKGQGEGQRWTNGGEWERRDIFL